MTRMSISWASQLLILAILLFGQNLAFAQDCSKTSTTNAPTIVYDRAPQFSSGGGWTLGEKITTLAKGKTVHICEERSVGLFFSKQVWYRILLDNRQFGWVFKGNLTLSMRNRDSDEYIFSIFGEAFAQPVDESDEPVAEPPPPPNSYGLVLFFFFAFVVIIVGMIAKVVFDQIDKASALKIRELLDWRKCIKALIVSPIVFGTFLAIANFENLDQTQVIVILLSAFQNGFFWQTVLPTASKKAKPA